MQLQDIVTRIRKTIGEPEPSGYNTLADGDGSWNNSQIIGYINEALGIISHDWHKESSSTVTLAANQTNIPLPTNCLEDGLRKVMYTTNGTVYPVHYLDFDKFQRASQLQTTTTTGAVGKMVYTVWGGNILIYPGVATSTDTVTLYFYRVPATLALAIDTPDIPPRFHLALVEYGIAECQTAVEELQLAGDSMQKWERYRAQFKAEMARNQRDKGIRIRGRR